MRSGILPQNRRILSLFGRSPREHGSHPDNVPVRDRYQTKYHRNLRIKPLFCEGTSRILCRVESSGQPWEGVIVSSPRSTRSVSILIDTEQILQQLEV
jgi:hypothetical protein